MDKKPLILSVEDNQTDISLMKRVFKKKLPQFKFVFLTDSDIAIHFINEQYLEKNLPVLILLDIKLIKGTGFDTLKYIRNNPKFKHITTLMLSSSERKDDKKKAADYGCNQYIEKPRDYISLTNRLPKIIEFWTQKKQ